MAEQAAPPVAIRVFMVTLTDRQADGSLTRFSMLAPAATTQPEALASAVCRFGAARVVSVE